MGAQPEAWNLRKPSAERAARVTQTNRKPRIPSYRLHKQSGQAIVTLPDGAGGRDDVLPGRHITPERIAEYRRVILEWQTGGRRSAAGVSRLSVNEVALAYFHHVEGSLYRRGTCWSAAALALLSWSRCLLQ
jgi:hypothetical protein